MDQRGPPEGAPVIVADPMDMTIIDKVCTETNWPDDNIVSSSTFCDHPKKLSNKLLFLTVIICFIVLKLYIYIYVCVCVCVYMHMDIYIYVHTYAYIFI
jgi:hypothetical protein